MLENNEQKQNDTQRHYQGQIIKALSGFYYIEESQTGQVYQTRGRGNFRQKDQSPLVGDWVEFVADNDQEGLVTAIAERKNAMIRPPVANVDLAFLVASVADPAISPKLIDRYLVYIESLGIQPVLYLSKLDLLTEDQVQDVDQLIALYQGIGYAVFTSEQDLSQSQVLKDLVQDQVVVAVGQSGVGKSTFLNEILPVGDIETAEVSKSLGRGRHTTRHSELHDVFGGKFADTPGFSNISIDYIPKEDLDNYLPEFFALKGQCKFRECTHQHEPKCAVKAALAADQISQQRYDSYVQMYQEIASAKPQYNKRK